MEVGGYTHYVSVPITLRLYLPVASVRPYVFGGPRADLKVGSTTDILEFEEIHDKFESVNFGAVAGAGIEIPADNFKFLVEGYYSMDVNKAYEAEELEVRNRSITLLAGIKFDL